MVTEMVRVLRPLRPYVGSGILRSLILDAKLTSLIRRTVSWRIADWLGGFEVTRDAHPVHHRAVLREALTEHHITIQAVVIRV